MKNTGFQASHLPEKQVPRPVWLAGKWDSLVRAATSAGPVVPTSAMGNFSANSPTGVQTFQAQYIMYAPFGPNPLSGVYTSASGIQFDMILYSWWYNF